MTFLNPLYLIGLAASALPVLFHLFARRRSRRVEFSSLRFLQKLEKTSMRAVKIRQILLLIIRTLLITAVVLAFARPALRGYLGGFFGSSHANTSMVFLIDNSASMSRSDDRGELLKQSKDAATSLAHLITEGDEATVIPLASIERGKEYRPLHNPRDVSSAISEIKLADRSANVADGLRMASSVLAQSHNVNKEVYLLSDGQLRNFRDSRNLQDSAKAMKLFDAATKCFTMTVGAGDRVNGRNLALDSVKPTTTVFEPGRPVTFEGWVRNTTADAATNIVLSLFYNDERVAQKTIPSIAAHATERVEVQGPVRGAGRIAIRAELESDALPFDNAHYAVIEVPSSRRIAVFTEDPSSATFLSLALSQSLTSATSGVPFVTDVKRTQELRTLSAFPDRYDAIFVLVGSTAMEAVDANALKSYLSGGHGAGLFLMPGMDIARSNQAFATIGLPQIITKEGSMSDASHYQSFARFDLRHPFFAGMFEAISTDQNSLRGIESPKIFEYYSIRDNGADPLIKLSNGFSFLNEVHVGKGDAFVFAIPPTMQFSDFPRKSIFLPLVRRTAAYASSIHTKGAEKTSQRFVTTEPFEVELPSDAKQEAGVSSSVLIKGPSGLSARAPVVMGADGRSFIHVDNANVAGNYTVYRDAEAREPVAAFAVNISSDESDLRSAGDAEIKEYLAARISAPKPVVIALSPTARDLPKVIDQSRYGVELWQSMLMAALLLAILELIVAREGGERVAPVAAMT